MFSHYHARLRLLAYCDNFIDRKKIRNKKKDYSPYNRLANGSNKTRSGDHSEFINKSPVSYSKQHLDYPRSRFPTSQ